LRGEAKKYGTLVLTVCLCGQMLKLFDQCHQLLPQEADKCGVGLEFAGDGGGLVVDLDQAGRVAQTPPAIGTVASHSFDIAGKAGKSFAQDATCLVIIVQSVPLLLPSSWIFANYYSYGHHSLTSMIACNIFSKPDFPPSRESKLVRKGIRLNNSFLLD
jgi:hypothetical protein